MGKLFSVMPLLFGKKEGSEPLEKAVSTEIIGEIEPPYPFVIAENYGFIIRTYETGRAAGGNSTEHHYADDFYSLFLQRYGKSAGSRI